MDCRYVGGPGLLPGRVRVGQRGGGGRFKDGGRKSISCERRRRGEGGRPTGTKRRRP